MSEERIEKMIATSKKAYETRKAKMRELYQLARELGYTPTEAQALSHLTREDFDNLTKLR